MEKDYLILKRASASRSSGEWKDDDFDVLANGIVVGRIFKVNAAPVREPWMWTLAFGHHEDRTPTHGSATTRETATGAFELASGIAKCYPITRKGIEETHMRRVIALFAGVAALTSI